MTRIEEALFFASHLQGMMFAFHQRGLKPQFGFVDYHGFEKATLPVEMYRHLLEANGKDDAYCQAEIIRVSRDLSAQLHHHEHSDAAIICLGEEAGVENPSKAKMYLDGVWIAATNQLIAVIPSGETHGFTVEDEGILYFLSVQIPPIVGDRGDDYVRDS